MRRGLSQTPWPVLLLIASFLAPSEFSVYLGSARLPLHRALLLLLVPLASFAASGRRGIRPKHFDLAFLGFAAWCMVVYLYHHGQADGLQSGGALAVDSFGSYLVARAYVRDEQALSATATTLFFAVIISGAIALPETLLGKIFVHDLLRDLTGYVLSASVEKRMGLTRAFGTFDHPIHLGTFCASAMALAAYAARKDLGATMRALFMLLATFASVSSAPLLSAGVQVGLSIIERYTRAIKGRGYLAMGGLLVVFGGISLVATRSPFALIATGLTLDSWTGYYRLMIWEHGLENVEANPWFGLGLNDWSRPAWMASPTIDSFWLVIAVRGGIPHIALLLAGVLGIAMSVGLRMRRSSREARRMATGWMISLIALVLAGCTVHYWNVPYAYFFFFLGLGGALSDPLKRRAAAAVRTVADEVGQPVVKWMVPHGAASAAPRSVVAARHAPAGQLTRWPVPFDARRELNRA